MVNPFYLLLYALLLILFIILIKNSNKPCIIITDEKIIHNYLYKTKEINLTDVTKIKFKVYRDFIQHDQSSVNGIHKSYCFLAFNKRKLLLKVHSITIDDLDRISNKVKNYNIKIVRR